jgi:hypothetical protein
MLLPGLKQAKVREGFGVFGVGFGDAVPGCLCFSVVALLFEGERIRAGLGLIASLCREDRGNCERDRQHYD